MPPLKSLIGAFFGASARLSDMERRILDCVRAQLDKSLVAQWDKQVTAINKIQRLPEGVEVNFYRMKGGRPTFDAELAFPNKTEELQLATVEVKLSNAPQRLVARVWCVKGFLFSIEYEGNASYFVEAAGMEDQAHLQFDCKLVANLWAAA